MLDDFFNEKLRDIQCNKITKSYIIGIFKKYKTANFDLSNENITLLFAKGVFENNFETFQNLADWLFFLKTLFPAFLKHASPEYYNDIAKISYYRCYKIMHTWKVYEELADQFEELTTQSRKILIQKCFNNNSELA